MPLKARIIIALLSFFLFAFVLNLIRIEYSILWLVISSIVLAASIWQRTADRFARFIGIDYPPAFFFLVAFFFMVMILLHFSIEMTKLKDQNKTLVQELSLLKRWARKK
jgi:hypothetical protein